MPDDVLKLSGITHRYDTHTLILENLNLSVSKGQMLALVGVSGLGKSTLLHIAGLMETPTGGTVIIDGETPKSDPQKTRIRQQKIGFVFQFHHLLPEFSALENLSLIGKIGGLSSKEATQRGQELLERVGLGHRLSHKPAALSGGECQRVAIARALMNHPKLLLLDEPTGNLDHNTATEVFGLIKQVIVEDQLACIYVTHNNDQAALADRRASLIDKQWVLIDD